MKTSLRGIIHRAVVQIIYKQYIPKSFKLRLNQQQDLEYKNKVFENLRQNGIQDLRRNLLSRLQICLGASGLRYRNRDVDSLGQFIGQLQGNQFNKLQFLDLYLEGNMIGQNYKCMKGICDVIEKITQNQRIQGVNLYLYKNQIGQNQDCIKEFGEAIGKFSQCSQLKQFGLYLSHNNLGGNMKDLGMGLKKLQRNTELQEVYLDFSYNNLGDNIDDIKYLQEGIGFGLSQCQKLQSFNLQLQGNISLKNRVVNMKNIGDMLKQFKKNIQIQNLSINLQNNQLESQNMQFMWRALVELVRESECLQNIALNLTFNKMIGNSQEVRREIYGLYKQLKNKQQVVQIEIQQRHQLLQMI